MEMESPCQPIIPGFPDDLAMRCLAKIPHGYHGLLETVSKRWRDVLRSTEYSSCKAKEGWCGDWLFLLTDRSKDQWIAYDPEADRWHPIPMIPRKHKYIWSTGFACVCVRDRFLVIGGTYCKTNPRVTRETPFMTSDVFQFDPFKKEWIEVASMKTPRSNFACCVMSGKVYVSGGRYMSHLNGIALAEVYDPLTNKWKELPAMPNTLMDCFSFSYNGKLHVFSDQDRRVWRRNNTQIARYRTEIFDPSKKVWLTQELTYPCSTFGQVAIQVAAEDSSRLYGVVTVDCGESLLKTRDSEEGEWHVVTEVPSVESSDRSRFLGVSEFGFAALGNALYVMGGRLFCEDQTNSRGLMIRVFNLNRTWIWDGSGKWRETRPLCRPSCGASLGFASLKEMPTTST